MRPRRNVTTLFPVRSVPRRIRRRWALPSLAFHLFDRFDLTGFKFNADAFVDTVTVDAAINRFVDDDGLAGLGVDHDVLPITRAGAAEVLLTVTVIDPRLVGAGRRGFGEAFVGRAEGDVDQIGRIADFDAPEPDFILGIRAISLSRNLTLPYPHFHPCFISWCFCAHRALNSSVQINPSHPIYFYSHKLFLF